MRLTSIESSFHVTFTAIVPGAYPGEAKMCLRLIAETDARSVGDSHPSCSLSFGTCGRLNCFRINSEFQNRSTASESVLNFRIIHKFQNMRTGIGQFQNRSKTSECTSNFRISNVFEYRWALCHRKTGFLTVFDRTLNICVLILIDLI